jgi:hypothetical protein
MSIKLVKIKDVRIFKLVRKMGMEYNSLSRKLLVKLNDFLLYF